MGMREELRAQRCTRGMSRIGDIYYTFQLMQVNPWRIIRVNKWAEGDQEPTQWYEVFPDGRAGAGQCSCPAYRVCKHIRCVEEAWRTGKNTELWKWRWTEKGGWEENHDI